MRKAAHGSLDNRPSIDYSDKYFKPASERTKRRAEKKNLKCVDGQWFKWNGQKWVLSEINPRTGKWRSVSNE